MPVTKDDFQAIRAVRGDIGSSQTVASDGFPTNIEFDRIYWGNDLKFDRMSSMYFWIGNISSSNITVKLAKTASNWSDAPTVKYIHSDTPTVHNTVDHSSSITLGSGKRLYFYTDGNPSGGIFSKDESNYFTFQISGTASAECGGNWGSLAKCIGTGIITSCCFYNLFNSCTALKNCHSLPTDGANIEEIQYNAMGQCFYGCTQLTAVSSGINARSIGDRAFFKTFYGCSSLTSIGDIIAESVEPAETQLDGPFYQMFYNCSALAVGPRISRSDGTMFNSTDGAYNSVFYYCSSLQSVRQQYIKDFRGTIGKWTFYMTFAFCQNFTGQGLDFSTSLYNENPGLVNNSRAFFIQSIGEYAFYRTFYNCTHMTKLPRLLWYDHELVTYVHVKVVYPLNKNGSMREFAYNSGLTGKISDDMVISISDTDGGMESTRRCYYAFYNNKSITSSAGIFYNCYKRLNESDCQSMFAGCTSMTEASIPQSTALVGPGCLSSMFSGCTSLTSVESSSDTRIESTATQCMYRMFYGCTSLTASPYLSAPELTASNAYREIFRGCTNLNLIITNQNQQGSQTSDWTYGLPSTGNYVALNSDNTSTTVNASGNTSNAHYIPYNWTKRSNYLSFQSASAFRIKVRQYGTPYSGTFSYIMMGSTVTTGTVTPTTSTAWNTSTSIQVPANSIFLLDFTGTGQFSKSESDYYTIEINATGGVGSVACSGSTRALMKYSMMSGQSSSYQFYRLFYNCTALYSGPDIFVTTADRNTSYRYKEIFSGCTSLVNPGRLVTGNYGTFQNSIIFGHYDLQRAFANTAIGAAVDLSVTDGIFGEGVFSEIFYNCQNLKEVSFPATTVALTNDCFSGMYRSCTGLESIPSGSLDWTALAPGCYNSMFYGCTSLWDVPSNLLPSTTMADSCYNSMFYGCTSLVNAPDLPATDTANTGCYNSMFYGCTSLKNLNVSFTAWKNSWGINDLTDTHNWVYGVPTDGNYKCSSAQPNYSNNSTNTGNSASGTGSSDTSACYIPYGWTRITSISVIPSDRFRMSRASGTLTVGPGTRTGAIQYSRDGYTWTDLTSSVTISSSYPNLCLRAKSVNAPLNPNETLFAVTGSGKVNLSGNIGYLYRQNSGGVSVNSSNLFRGASYISNCNGLFFLTGTNVECSRMFAKSTVTSVSKDLLSNVYVSGANSMFKQCASLTQGANLMPMNTVVDTSCFSEIYYGCGSLTSLASQTSSNWMNIGTVFSYNDGDNAFYRAFYGCGQNFQAVRINSRYLAKKSTSGYSDHTFKECFCECAGLTKMEARIVRWPDTSKTKDWVRGVSSTGTFYHTSELTAAPHGDSRIPSGWTDSTVS